MDNAAFTALVRGHAQGKTSKVIAREAVEEEFRRHKKKRRRGDGEDYLSSEEEGGEGDDGKKSKPQRFEKNNDWDAPAPGGEGVETKEEGGSKYRDRAKERREGKQQSNHLHRVLDDDPTKDIGEDGDDGDNQDVIIQANTKKGLDLELVRQMKREIHYGTTTSGITNKHSSKAMGSTWRLKGYDYEDDDDMDKKVRSYTASISVEEARKFLQARISTTTSTTTAMGGDHHITNDDNSNPTNKSLSKKLGYDLLEYLESVLHHPSATMTTSEPQRGYSRRTEKRATSSSGSAGIQRGMQQAHSTFLVFALEGNPLDKIRAWEAPREFTRHGGGGEGGGGKRRGGLTRQQGFLEKDDDNNEDDGDSVARATPLNTTLLQAVERALAKHTSNESKHASVDPTMTRPENWQQDNTMKTAATATTDHEAIATNITTTKSLSRSHLPPYAMTGTTKSTSSSTSAKLGSNRQHDDDDDDIFGDDIGGGYVYSAPGNGATPTPSTDSKSPHTKQSSSSSSLAKQAAQLLSATTRISKGSIFSGLVTSNNHDNMEEQEEEDHGEGDKDKASSSDQVDHFVQNLYSRLRQRGQQQGPASSTSKLKGSEQGGGERGYDDEMDVDFDGRLDDEDGSSQDGSGSDKKSKKKKGGSRCGKKQAEETTLAVKEYGARRGRRSGAGGNEGGLA